MGRKFGKAKVKILKSGRYIHVQNFSKYPLGQWLRLKGTSGFS